MMRLLLALAVLLLSVQAYAQPFIPFAGGYKTIQDEGVALSVQNTLNFVGTLITCSNDAPSQRTVCTLSDATSEYVPSQTAAIFTYSNPTGSGVTATSATPVLLNGQLVKEYDPQNNWTVTAGKLEACWQGPSNRTIYPMAIVQVKRDINETNTGDYTSHFAMGIGSTPVGYGGNWGHFSEMQTDLTFTQTVQQMGTGVLAPDIDNGQCVGLMLGTSDSSDMDVIEAQLFIDADENIYRDISNSDYQGGFTSPEQSTGPMPVFELYSYASQGMRATTGITLSINGSMWIRGPRGGALRLIPGAAPGMINRILIGRSEAELGNDPYRGYAIAEVDIISKNNPYAALALWPREDTTGNPANLLQIFGFADQYYPLYDNPPKPFFQFQVQDTWIAQMEGLGYGTSGFGPNLVLRVDQNGTGYFSTVLATSASGSGGGLCVANSATEFANADAAIADATCLANDGIATATYPNGRMFLDDGDGTKEAGEEYISETPPGPDTVGTVELDDTTNDPTPGYFVQVAGDNSTFTYAAGTVSSAFPLTGTNVNLAESGTYNAPYVDIDQSGSYSSNEPLIGEIQLGINRDTGGIDATGHNYLNPGNLVHPNHAYSERVNVHISGGNTHSRGGRNQHWICTETQFTNRGTPTGGDGPVTGCEDLNDAGWGAAETGNTVAISDSNGNVYGYKEWNGSSWGATVGTPGVPNNALKKNNLGLAAWNIVQKEPGQHAGYILRMFNHAQGDAFPLTYQVYDPMGAWSGGDEGAMGARLELVDKDYLFISGTTTTDVSPATTQFVPSATLPNDYYFDAALAKRRHLIWDVTPITFDMSYSGNGGNPQPSYQNGNNPETDQPSSIEGGNNGAVWYVEDIPTSSFSSTTNEFGPFARNRTDYCVALDASIYYHNSSAPVDPQYQWVPIVEFIVDGANVQAFRTFSLNEGADAGMMAKDYVQGYGTVKWAVSDGNIAGRIQPCSLVTDYDESTNTITVAPFVSHTIDVSALGGSADFSLSAHGVTFAQGLSILENYQVGKAGNAVAIGIDTVGSYSKGNVGISIAGWREYAIQNHNANVFLYDRRESAPPGSPAYKHPNPADTYHLMMLVGDQGSITYEQPGDSINIYYEDPRDDINFKTTKLIIPALANGASANVESFFTTTRSGAGPPPGGAGQCFGPDGAEQYYDTTNNVLYVCDGGAWQGI